MHIIRNIKDIFGDYGIDFVDCFEHPVAILYRYTYKESDILFLIIQKLMLSYQNDEHSFPLKDYSKFTGVKCISEIVNGQLINKIKEKLMKDLPVLVPGNLVTVYYSSSYKERDWPHLFLINGYDDEKQLFYLLDHTQIQEDEDHFKYCGFFMKYEDLEETFRHVYGFVENKIFYMERINDGLSYKDRLSKLLSQLSMLVKNNEKEEFNIVEQYNEYSEERSLQKEEKSRNYIMNIPKFRNVILEQIIRSMQNYSYDFDTLKQISLELYKLWRGDCSSLVKRLVTAKKGEMIEFRCQESTIKYEQRLVEELDKYIEFLKDGCNDADISHCQFENNEDNIVKEVCGGYVFQINTGKLYNSWFLDECPKVVLYDYKQEYRENIEIRTKLMLPDGNVTAGHQEGIFIRTGNEKLYVFGIDYEQNFVFEQIGIGGVGDLNCDKYAKRSVELFLRKKKEEINVGIVDKDGKNVVLGRYKMNLNIKCAGIFCKTYNRCKELVVRFDECKIIV